LKKIGIQNIENFQNLGNQNLESTDFILLLIKAFKNDESKDVRKNAIMALCKQNLDAHYEILSSLIEVLKESNENYIREVIVKALGNQNLNSHPEIVPLLSSILLNDWE